MLQFGLHRQNAKEKCKPTDITQTREGGAEQREEREWEGKDTMRGKVIHKREDDREKEQGEKDSGVSV